MARRRRRWAGSLVDYRDDRDGHDDRAREHDQRCLGRNLRLAGRPVMDVGGRVFHAFLQASAVPVSPGPAPGHFGVAGPGARGKSRAMETNRLGSADRALRLFGRIAVAALVVQGAAFGSGLNGTWRMDVPKPSGATLHSFLVLHQDGARIEGQVIANGSVGVPIRGAHVEGPDTVFSINWGWNFRVTARGRQPAGRRVVRRGREGRGPGRPGARVRHSATRRAAGARGPRPPGQRAGEDAADGLEQLEPLRGVRRRQGRARDRRRHGRLRHGGGRLRLREHRRHLGGRARRPGRTSSPTGSSPT